MAHLLGVLRHFVLVLWAVLGDEGLVRGSLLDRSLARPSHHPETPKRPQLLEVGWFEQGCLSRGMPVSRDARECLAGMAGSWGTSPTAPLAMARPLPPSTCAPLPTASCGSPGPGSPCCSLHACRGSEQGWVPHTKAAVSLFAVFLPFVCVFLILSPRKQDQLQQ